MNIYLLRDFSRFFEGELYSGMSEDLLREFF